MKLNDTDKVLKNAHSAEGLNALRDEVFSVNAANGWADEKHEPATNFMLVVSELSEAMEADRKGKYVDKSKLYDSTLASANSIVFKEAFEKNIKDTVEDEIADAVIRCLDVCAKLNIDIQRHVELKLRYNTMRGYKHGGKKY